MDELLLFTVLGLGIGAVHATLGASLVLTYAGTGVINFAVAAMAAVGAHVYDELNRNDRLELPLPYFPAIDTGPLPLVADLAIATGVAVVLGLAVQGLVFGPLRTAPPLGKVVASIGVLITLQAALALTFGTQGRPRSAILPDDTIAVAEVQLPWERLALVALVALVALGLSSWLRLSRTGLAVRAAAENERSAALAGLSPQRLATLTWVASTVLTTLVLIVAGTVTPVLGPFTWSLLVVPALAAALFGRLTSITATVIAGLALGVVQSVLQYLSNTRDWWPDWARIGLSDAVPFLAIVIALYVAGTKLPVRGSALQSGLPRVFVPRNRPAAIAIWTAVGVAAVVLFDGNYRFGLITSLAFMLITLSLVVLTGFVGQISLAQAAFAGTAGFALAKLGGALPFPFGIVVASLFAAVVGVLVGLPAIRIRGIQLAVVSLAAAVAVERFVFGNSELLDPLGETLGDPSLFGVDLAIREGRDIARLEFGLTALAIVVVAFVLTGNLLRGRTGKLFLAVRSNERAASAVGISTTSAKLLAFGLSAFLAGIGGTLIGYSRGQLSPASFGVIVGLTALASAYLGGITLLSGAVLGGLIAPLGLFFVTADDLLDLSQGRTAWYTLFSGVSLILTTVLNPIGIAGKIRDDLERKRREREHADALAHAARAAEASADPASPPGPVAAGSQRGAVSERVGVSASAPGLEDPPSPGDRALGRPVLVAADVAVSFGGLRAVDGVSLEVRAGEVLGLIGPNGAGKTTFVDAITGFVPSTGTVTVAGTVISDLDPAGRARAGLARTWQSGELFEELTVRGNVEVAVDPRSGLGSLIDAVAPNRHDHTDTAERALALVGLDELAELRPSELALGQQKLLSVARAVAMSPEVLLMDEPAAGLNVDETQAFAAHLRRIAAGGVAVLLIDHDMTLVLDSCDRIHVLDFGETIAEGTPAEVRADPAVVAAYLGGEAEPAATGATAAPSGPAAARAGTPGTGRPPGPPAPEAAS